jgi:hypothetical protein
MDKDEFKKFMEESFDRRMEICESIRKSREYLESLPDQPERLNPEDVSNSVTKEN